MSDRTEKTNPSKHRQEAQPASAPPNPPAEKPEQLPQDATTGSEGGGPRVGMGGSPDDEED
jgi:hypothetical protein